MKQKPSDGTSSDSGLLKNRFFACFTPAGAQVLAGCAQETSHEESKILFEEGDLSDSVYLVLEGKVRLSKKSSGQHEVEIAVVEAGDYFGELGAFDHAGRSAQATTVGETRVATIPGDFFMEVLEREPLKSAMRLFSRVLEHLRATNERFAREMVKKEKMQTLGEMSSMIVHDLKNPIATIQMAAELVSRKQEDPEIQRKCEIIRLQSKRMVAMLQELLDFSRGKPALKKEVTAISALFDQFQSLNQVLLNRPNIQFSIKSIPARVHVDSGAILRVLQNLAGNALDAMAGQKGELSIEAKEVEEWVEILVRDTGPGIPESIRENLFDPFVTAGKKNGVGLGLSIAKSFIEAHEGKILFKTETGKGTTFFLWLPLFRE